MSAALYVPNPTLRKHRARKLGSPVRRTPNMDHIDTMTDLQTRWTNPHFAHQAASVIGRLRDSSAVRDLDLRGITIGGNESSGSFDIHFQNKSVQDSDLSYATLNCSFLNARLQKVAFRVSKFDDATFKKATVLECDFTDATIEASDLSDMECSDSVFTNVRMKDRRALPLLLLRSRFQRCDFSRAVIVGAEFRAASFSDCKWDNAVFKGCDLRGTKFHGTSPSQSQISD